MLSSRTKPIEVGSRTSFPEGVRATKKPIGSRGPYATVELGVPADVKQQDLRCQILDDKNAPITLFRGQNVDTTFADGGSGPWTFQDGHSLVSAITCDPAFKKHELDTAIRVTLSDGNLATQTAFDKAGLEREQKTPVGSPGPYNSVNLSVGADVENQGLRCQIIDNNGKAIEVKRGENEDVTFADGGNGAWTFLKPEESEVGYIICDPAFVKAA